jgi:hypothetical protein
MISWLGQASAVAASITEGALGPWLRSGEGSGNCRGLREVLPSTIGTSWDTHTHMLYIYAHIIGDMVEYNQQSNI